MVLQSDDHGRNMHSISPSLPTKRSSPKESYFNEKRSHVPDTTSDEVMEVEPTVSNHGGFVSARNQYIADQQKKFGKTYNPSTDKYTFAESINM